MSSPVNTIRKRLDANTFTLLPFVYDGLTAKVAAHIGFDALYMTGFGTAASLGMPDVGLTTMTEMVANVARVVEASGLPVIADADTGYGNPLNVQRMVRAYEKAGAAGLHIEDQVSPKKCGFFEGKQVIPVEEHVQKIRAALDARVDPSFVIIARTDALAVDGWDDVVERVEAYREAGADVVFVDGIKTKTDLDNYVELVVKKGLPALYNGALVSAHEAEELGFRLQICGSTHRTAYYAARSSLLVVKETGQTPSGPLIKATADLVAETPPITEVLDLPGIYALEQRYGVGSS